MPWEPDVPLGPRTRYRIGGPARLFAEPGDLEALREAHRALEGRPYRVLGGGANTLVADRGVETAVFRLGPGLGELRLEEEAIVAGAAAKLPALVSLAREAGRRGFVSLEAVPGTVGGGLRMNAGSRERWLWHRVEWVEAMSPEGRVRRLGAGEVRTGYRSVELPEGWIFLRTRLSAPPGPSGEIEEAHRSFRHRKLEAQVYDLRSVGSVWKNPGPPHGSAWEVVERVGMRGARRCDAQVSVKHANFIVNLGQARAEDVRALMAETWRRAHEDLGLELEPEIRLWGFTPEELATVGGAA